MLIRWSGDVIALTLELPSYMENSNTEYNSLQSRVRETARKEKSSNMLGIRNFKCN